MGGTDSLHVLNSGVKWGFGAPGRHTYWLGLKTNLDWLVFAISQDDSRFIYLFVAQLDQGSNPDQTDQWWAFTVIVFSKHEGDHYIK